MTDSLRLFLIEDDDDISLLMRKALDRAGHLVTRCRSAADALIVLGHATFDLVLLDQKLPDMSGLELLQILSREGITAPVLMVTAHGDEDLASQVLRAGALDYVVKDLRKNFLGDLAKRVSESYTKHQLQQNNRLLIESLESARDGILITDQDGIIRHVNRALEHMTGYTRQELTNKVARQLPCVAQPPGLFEALCPTILARKSWQGELTLRRKDQNPVEASLSVSPIFTREGQLTHFVAILRDNTERKHMERQLLQAQKMQSIGTLAGGVAHEFNNLLAGINGYAALGLREPNLGGQLREFLRHIVDLSERAALLTRQLLAFARKPALTRRPTPMLELVRGTADLVARTLHLEVRLDVDEAAADGTPLQALADANQLQQALVNLALNARDALAHPAGGEAAPQAPPPHPTTSPPIVFRLRHVVLSAESLAWPQNVPAGDYVLLEVADCGAGMTPEVLNQALDPFYTTKEVGQGTGLGLPMVFGIVQGHQGYLTIDSAPGRGTAVRLYLPRLVGARPAGAELAFEAGQVLEPETLPGHNILVIDDEEAVQDVVRRFLEIAGHRVSCASSGHEALELLAGGQAFDLVILDLLLPREDGAAVFLRLRQRRPDLPVLLCTGMPQADPAPQLLQAGRVGLIRKPFRMNELWYAVKQALAER
jgi:two-component system cell cycle sensor histidine kinase/response regulator CckA